MSGSAGRRPFDQSTGSRWHEIDAQYGVALVTTALRAAMDAGYIEDQPVAPLAQLLLAALNEAALSIARAEDVAAARRSMGATLSRLIEGLRPGR